MRKYLKRLFVIMLICICTFSSFGGTKVYAATVKLNKSSANLYVGESVTLKLNGTKKTVKWSTSNKNVASVSSKGKVTAKKKGTATISAKCNGKSYKCKIIVKPISLNKSSATIKVGDSINLKLNGAKKKITWSSSDNSIAKVSSKGVVSARKKGKVTITAKHDGKNYKCNIRVNDKKKEDNVVTGITLNCTSKEIKEDESFVLTATVTPSNVNNYTIEWSSSDSSIAKVENGIVTGVKEGTATITASCLGYSASCTVKVNKNIISVTGIALNSTSKEIKEDESFVLTATVTPSNVNNYTIEWSSSDSSIAKVENGIVTGVKEGTATITASCSGYSASCTVKVNKNIIVKMNQIWMDNPGSTYNIGDSVVIHLQAESTYDINSVILWLKSEENSSSIKSAVSKVDTGNGVFDLVYTITDNMYPGKWIPDWSYIYDKYGTGTTSSNLASSYSNVYFYVAE